MPLEGANEARLFSVFPSEKPHSMKKHFQLVAAALLVAGAATIAARPAHALPSGLGAFPSTDMYSKGNIHFDADSYTSTNLKTSVLPTQGLTYGIGPDKNGVLGRSEAGYDVNFNSPTSNNGQLSFGNRIFFNAKTQLYNDDKREIRVVTGGWLLGSASSNPNYVYLLGSKNFKQIGRIHVGYAYGLTKGLFNTTSGSGDTAITRAPGRSSLQLGYDRLITPKLQFVADYYSGKSPFAGVQPTVYYSVNDKASFGVGYFRLNNRQAPVKDQIYFAFAYNFDFNKAAPTPGSSNPSPATGTGPAASPPSNGGPAPVPSNSGPAPGTSSNTNGGPAPVPAP